MVKNNPQQGGSQGQSSGQGAGTDWFDASTSDQPTGQAGPTGTAGASSAPSSITPEVLSSLLQNSDIIAALRQSVASTATTSDKTDLNIVADPETLAIVTQLEKAGELTADDKKELVRLASVVEYQGLNTEKMRKYISYKLKSEASPAKDLRFLIIVAAMRGNNYDRVYENAGDSPDIARLKTLVQTLGIKKRIPQNDKCAVTLTRIMSCYPLVTMMVASAIKPPGVAMDVEDGFPYCMRQQSFGGMIPDSSNADNIKIKKAFIVYQCKVTIQLDPKFKEITQNLLRRQKQFVDMAMRQSKIGADKKKNTIDNLEHEIYVYREGTTTKELNKAVVKYAELYDTTMTATVPV